MLKYYLSLCILIAMFLISCAGSIPEPTVEHVQYASARWPGTELKDLSEGRHLYISKCSGCHSLEVPSSLTEAEWKPMMKKMGKKAKLNNTEYEKILQFVTTMAKR